MPETIKGLGRVLAEWRYDDKDTAGVSATIDEWAAQLKNHGCSASRIDIAGLLQQAELSDFWTLTFSCDCFDDFLYAVKRGIYRGRIDDQRWANLNGVFFSARMRCLGLLSLTNHP